MKHFIVQIRCFIALLFAKLAIAFLRLTGSGGTSFPGKLALTIYPDILAVLARKYRIIMVTGTNGKTTTSRMIEQVLKENHISYTANKSGANLLSGLTATLIADIRLNRMPKSQSALLEVDEAAFRLASKHLQPSVLVVTNFFRDQLDRYGELYSTLKSSSGGISRLPETTLILTQMIHSVASLGNNVPNPVIYFGMGEAAVDQENSPILNNDASYCLYCKTKYEYQYHTYGHLGHFQCPGCGYSRPEALIQVEKLPSLSEGFSRAVFNTPSGTFAAQINLPGLYNVYNALAAVSFAEALGFSHEKTIKALSRFESGFWTHGSILAGR